LASKSPSSSHLLFGESPGVNAAGWHFPFENLHAALTTSAVTATGRVDRYRIPTSYVKDIHPYRCPDLLSGWLENHRDPRDLCRVRFFDAGNFRAGIFNENRGVEFYSVTIRGELRQDDRRIDVALTTRDSL
jgi:hypothetical protein